MTAAQELEKLVVRIVGDGSHYTRTLDKVVKDTTTAVAKINKEVSKPVRVRMPVVSAPVVNKAMMGGTSLAALNADLPKAAKAPKAAAVPKEATASVTKATAVEKAHTKAIKDTTAALPAATKAQETHTKAIKDVVAPLNKARDANGRFLKGLKDTVAAHNAGAGAARRHGGVLGMFSNMVAGAGRRIHDTAGRLKGAGQMMGIMGAVMAVSVTLPILGAAGALVKLASDAETTSNQFAVMLGADQGAKMLANIRKMGAETPFEFPELAASAKTLVGFGTAQEAVLPTLKTLGDVAAGTGKDIRELSVIYGQIQGMGRLQGQDFLQLVNAGFPVGEIAKTIGTDMNGLKAAMEDGAVSAEVVAETFRRLTSEGGQFHNMMEVLSKTATGKFSTLVDAVKEVAVSMGSYLLPTVKTVLDYLTAGATWFKNLGEAAHKTVMFIVALVGGVAPLIIALGTFFTITGFLGVGLTAMFMAGLKLVLIFAALAAGVYLLVRGFQMLVDRIYGEGSFVGALKAAGMAAWAFAQNVLGFIMNIKQNIQILSDWMVLQFNNAFGGILEAWGVGTDAFNAKTEKIASYLWVTFERAKAHAYNFALNVIGFIANIGENFNLLMGWFGRNWGNMLKDLGMAYLTFGWNTIKNLGVILETMLRLWMLFRGYLQGVFQSIFTVDFLKWVYTGITKAADVFLNFVDSAWEALKSIFSGDKASGLASLAADLGTSLANDFKTGMEGDLMGGVTRIVTEQAGKWHKPLDGFEASTEAMPEFNLDRGNVPKVVTDVLAPVKEAEEEAKKTAPEVETMALDKKKEEKKKEEDAKEETRTGEFKQMSLKQFSVNTVGLNNAPKKKQEVTDTGVQGKLDEVVGAIKGQKQPAVMGR